MSKNNKLIENVVKRILQARVYDVAIKTPLQPAHKLSDRLGLRVLLKREDQQPVHSFKLRGAYNKIAMLSDEQLARGVVTASAGNHAQGVALSAQSRQIKATIVMPRTTPSIKVDAVRRLGGHAVLHGDTYDEACAYAENLAKEKGASFVHPFDDPDVIAGQGTVAKELLDQAPQDLAAVYIPVGGGGLAAGMAAYIKYVRPDIKVIAVEPEDAACLDLALQKKRRATLKEVGLFADGVAVKQIGAKTFELLKIPGLVDEVVTANVDEICAAIKDIFEDTRSIPEPAGALALAGLKKHVQATEIKGQSVTAIVSGANMNFDRLRHVAERTEVGEAREAVLAVTIPEKPGAFRAFCSLIGKRMISEFNYRYADNQSAVIFVGVKLAGEDEHQELLDILAAEYEVADLTSNEVAKVHVRYMVGGHSPQANDECLYRFQFPERPGALMQFLRKVGKKWNISLFHYRNHGAAYGRVLVGLQIPKGERKAFEASLAELGDGYQYWPETDNPAYSLFLG